MDEKTQEIVFKGRIEIIGSERITSKGRGFGIKISGYGHWLNFWVGPTEKLPTLKMGQMINIVAENTSLDPAKPYYIVKSHSIDAVVPNETKVPGETAEADFQRADKIVVTEDQIVFENIRRMTKIDTELRKLDYMGYKSEAERRNILDTLFIGVSKDVYWKIEKIKNGG